MFFDHISSAFNHYCLVSITQYDYGKINVVNMMFETLVMQQRGTAFQETRGHSAVRKSCYCSWQRKKRWQRHRHVWTINTLKVKRPRDQSDNMRQFMWFLSDVQIQFCASILTLLGSDPLHRESYRDSSLSQLGPHRTSLAPPSWNSLAHSEQQQTTEQEPVRG